MGKTTANPSLKINKMSDKLTVAICGRPNVGKSTLFNRLAGKRKAIVSPIGGTTRDILEAVCQWEGKSFKIIDTGGIESNEKNAIDKEVQEVIDLTIKKADLILFLTDGRLGLEKDDLAVSQKIQKIIRKNKTAKKIIVAVNKVDSVKQEDVVYDFYKLGLGEPIAISAQTGRGCDILLDKIVKNLPKKQETSEETNVCRVGIIGRQNAGKSSLVNALINEKRMIVSDIPGTTRDAIDTEINYLGNKIILTDTAGIRRKKKIGFGIERFSTRKSLGTITKCDVILFILDLSEDLARQDFRLAMQFLKAKKSIIIVLNKWDLVEKAIDPEKYVRFLNVKLGKFSWAPKIFVSTKTGHNIKNVFELILKVYAARHKMLAPEEIEKFFEEVIRKRPPPKIWNKRQAKIRAFFQTSNYPPRFILNIGAKGVIPPYYFRFLEKKLRRYFDFTGSPIEIAVEYAS